MSKILCATRGGEAAVRNQKAAIERAKETNSDLVFFYVVDVEFMAHADYALRSDVVASEMDKMADFLLAMAVERAVKAGVDASAIIKHGDFVEQFKETIRDEEITLAILGRPAEGESKFVLEGLKQLADSVEEETGTPVWIPGLEEESAE